MPEIRRLVRDGEYMEADRLSKQAWGVPPRRICRSAIWVAFDHGDSPARGIAAISICARASPVRYRIGSVTYIREVLRANRTRPSPAPVGGRTGMSELHGPIWSPLRHRTTADRPRLTLHGRAPSHVDPNYYDRDEPGAL